MARFIIRRVLWMFLVLFVVSLVTFFLMHAVPGGPFDSEKALPKETMENLRARYNLDDPLYKQYISYITDVVVPRVSTEKPKISVLESYLINAKVGPVYFRWMNFGPSYTSKSRAVSDILRDQFPVSLQLGIMAVLLAVAIGIPLGILAALRQNSFWDYAGMGIAIFGVSVPAIVLGPILVMIFAVVLKWLPASGWGAKPPFILGFLPRDLSADYFRYALLPVLALGMAGSAIIARLTRASLLQVIREDYIRTARAKGLSERVVITRHALRNSLVPVVTVLGPYFAAVVTGTFVVELVFGIPGLGKYFVSSVSNRDYPVIMGTILLYAIVLVVANTVVDIAYAFLDPRIRIQ
jgi:ABC-type dipeptide/oligopeptide/nickel transport system permease component